MAGLVACGGGGDVSKAAVESGTYADRSSQEQYCDLVAATSLQLDHDLANADADSVLPTFHAMTDIATLAPEEAKADWAAMRSLMQVVVDGTNIVGTTEVTLDEADEAFEQISARVAEELESLCGISIAS
jgi:hypothetical protein